MAELEKEIRPAFERRLAAMPARPDLRARVTQAVGQQSPRPQIWRVAAATGALLLVGGVAFFTLLARHVPPTPIIGPTPTPSVSPSPTRTATACLPSSPAAFPAPTARIGGSITTVAGGPNSEIRSPYAVAVNIDGVIYIGDAAGLQRVGTDGSITTNNQYVNALSGTTGVTIAPRDRPGVPPGGQPASADDMLYATQFTKDLVVRVHSTNQSDLGKTVVIGGIQGPVGIVAAQQTGVFYLAASTSNRVLKVTVLPGQSINNMDWQVSSCDVVQSSAVSRPAGLALDAQGNLYIADSGNNRIDKVGLDGTIRTVAGRGTVGFSGDGSSAVQAQLNAPTGVAVDDSGTLFIADTGNNRVRRVSPDGTITTVAGSGAKGFSGDGGTAVKAELSGPTGVAIGPDGALYIADFGNNRIRKIGPS
jgi:trimeric autotransporter adhesin